MRHLFEEIWDDKTSRIIVALSGAFFISISVFVVLDKLNPKRPVENNGVVLSSTTQKYTQNNTQDSSQRKSAVKGKKETETKNSTLPNTTELKAIAALLAQQQDSKSPVIVTAPSTTKSKVPECDEQATLKKAKACTIYIETDLKRGSGFSTKDRFIITNRHVIEGAEEINVYHGKSKLSAELWGYSEDPEMDLAVLRTDESLPTCSFTDSDKISLAETLYAVGFPFSTVEEESSITRGVFSRKIFDEDGFEYLQTDTPINFGNSGGPLINQCGIVGINTIKMVGSYVEGFNYAIPSNAIKNLVNDYIAEGSETDLPIDEIKGYHYSCSNFRCVMVDGDGDDDCESDLNCIHSVCEEGFCRIKEDAGDFECWSDFGCRHKECLNNKCTEINTPGLSVCYSDSTCMK